VKHTAPPAPIALLLDALDGAYNERRKAWHGPNLQQAIGRVNAAQAARAPAPGRRCIAELVLHAAYWKYAAWRRLTGADRGSFALKGSNWFPLPRPFGEDQWRSCKALLDEQHRALRSAVERLGVARLSEVPKGAKVTNAVLLTGMAMHDVYHAGQIQLIKQLTQ